MIKLEFERIKIVKYKLPISNLSDFSNDVISTMNVDNKKSCLIVVNTIKTCIKLTEQFNKYSQDYNIFHISGYLTPNDRKKTFNEINVKLKSNEKIIVISTSVIECGVDISFDIGYRQVCGLNSILQVGGRINREHMVNFAKLYVFDFDSSLFSSGEVSENPAFGISKRIFNNLNDNQITAEYCTDAINKERQVIGNTKALRLINAESDKKFQFIGDEFNVIDNMTITIIVDVDIINKINKNEHVSYRDIMNNSVQIWFSNLNKPLYVTHINQLQYKDKTHYIWNGPYNSKYGIGQIFAT